MKRTYLIFFLLLFYSSSLFGQNNILNDSISEKGKLVQQISKNSISAIKIRNIKESTEYVGYKLCEHQYLEILKLENQITESEIEQLIDSENGTLKCVGFILFAKNNNNKSSVLQKMNYLLKQKYYLMTNSCSDAISTTSLPKYCFDLINSRNFFFKPNFKLKKKEKKEWNIKMMVYEMKK